LHVKSKLDLSGATSRRFHIDGGGEDHPKKITVNGHVLDVPSNLEDALQALRKLPETKEGVKYWIDYLSINQAEDSVSAQIEKRHQIKLMPRFIVNA
jgi:Heterokaryon incompatibility protein (HET)